MSMNPYGNIGLPTERENYCPKKQPRVMWRLDTFGFGMSEYRCSGNRVEAAAEGKS
jgi:hypothetical protein